MLKITLPDGSIKEFDQATTPLDIAKSISEGLARNTISAMVNGTQVETTTPITEDSTVQLLTWNDDLGKKAFWHSSAHLLAQAILDFYPKAKLTIGPAIEQGFYYDVDFGDEVLSEKDFEKIEKKMLEHARLNSTFEKYPVSKADALKEYADNEFKTELITNLNDGEITFVKHEDFIDLCRGGHIPGTGIVKAVKVLNAAGAYWRGNEKNKQLTRVYGISFPKQKDLTEYLERLEEAKRRDHRKLGKELGIFAFSEKVGAGLPLWLPKGTALRKKLEEFLSKAQKKGGYEFVMTPHIGSKELYVTSGHW
ncbi:MAG: TGS domain-containing protein, partial [Chryseobacterium sp.]|nr:TGS domain-containing protein [Chryseobacterium sp.]